MAEADPKPLQSTGRLEPTPYNILNLVGQGIGLDFQGARDGESLFEFIEGQGEVIAESRRLIRELTGLTLKDVIHKANNGTSGLDPLNTKLKREIREKIYENFHFLRRYSSDEYKEEGLRELGLMANDYINRLIESSSYKDYAKDLEMNDEVTNCDDVPSLILMAFDDRQTGRIKFEALRKLSIIKFLADARDYSEKDLDHTSALEEMMSFLNDRMIKAERKGELHERHLVANSDEEGATKKSYIVDSIEEIEEEENQHIIRIPSRKMARQRKGKDVYFSQTARKKTLFARLNKALDGKCHIGLKDVDRNGVQMLFESREDWQHFFDEFLKQLIDDVVTNLGKNLTHTDDEDEKERTVKRIESLIDAKFVNVRKGEENGKVGKVSGMYLSKNQLSADEIIDNNPDAFFSKFASKAGTPKDNENYEKERENIDDTIIIYQLKDTLDGEGFDGSRESSSPDLKVFKFKIEIRGSDEKKRHYEFQIFLPDGYADSKYRKGVVWEGYSIRRSANVGKVIFPEHIYGINHDMVKNKALEALYKKLGF